MTVPAGSPTSRRDLPAHNVDRCWNWGRLGRAEVWITAVVIFAVTTVVGKLILAQITSFGAGFSDLPLHIQLLLDSKKDGNQLGYTIYYTLLDVFSFGSSDPKLLRVVTVVLLGSMLGLRAVITYLALSLTRLNNWVRIGVTAASMVIIPLAIPGGDALYLGKFSPVIWHNSTTILAAPFCVALALAVCEYLTRANPPRWLHIALPLLVIAAGVTKPNYLLALMPAMALYCLGSLWATPSRRRWRRFTFLAVRAGIPAVVAVGVLAVLYLQTFAGAGLMIKGQKVGTGIRPMAIWQLLTSNPGWALIASIALPLAATVVLPSAVRRSLPVILIWLTTGVAIGEFILLAEILSPSGTILGHGNWMWGSHLSMTVTYVLLAVVFVDNWKQLPRYRWIVVGLAVVAVVTGLYFLAQILGGTPPTWVKT